jgi:hypothetical protein
MTTTMTTTTIPITKQLHINRLNLSYDVLNEIKSYCFYDIKTWETINFIKYKKDRIKYLFETSTISRAQPYDIYFNDSNTDQQWVFWTFIDDGPNPQFQSYNCKHCGNYKIIGNNGNNYIDKITCFCVDFDDDIPPLIDINDNTDDDDNDSIGV